MTPTILGIRSGALGDVLLGIPSWQAIRRANPSALIVVAAPSGPAQFIASSVPGPIKIIRPDTQSIADLYHPAPSPDLHALRLAHPAPSPDLHALRLAHPAPSPDLHALRYVGADSRSQNYGSYRSAEGQGFDWASVTHAVVWTQSGFDIADRLRARGVGCVVVAPPFPPAGDRTHVSEWLASTIEPVGGVFTDGWDASPWIMQPGLDTPPHPNAPDGNTLRLAHPNAPDGNTLRFDDHWYGTEDFSGCRFVVVHPGSGSARKCWPTPSWHALIRDLEGQGYKVMVLEGEADGPAVEAITSAMSPGMVRVIRGRSLAEVARLIANACGVIANDSGIAHLAAGLGVPTVAIFGPTDPAVWRPRGPNVRVCGGTAGATWPHHPAPSPDLHALRHTGAVVTEGVIWPEVDEVISAIAAAFMPA